MDYMHVLRPARAQPRAARHRQARRGEACDHQDWEGALPVLGEDSVAADPAAGGDRAESQEDPW
eukprot:5354944-Prymnesium_polylepis.1